MIAAQVPGTTLGVLEITIPGRPAAQGRPRATTRGQFATVYEDSKSREAKAMARDAMVRTCEAQGLDLPAFGSRLVMVQIVCVFPLPKSAAKKTEPVRRTWSDSGRNDVDNLGKLYMDAATGVLWADDSQVVRLVVERWRGAQGEHARTEITVEAAP